METRLKYVYEVYLNGSFTKAAQKLYISQPSLSAMVKKAETDLGCPIFDRSTFPLELTEEGKIYIEYIRQILQNEEDLTEKLSDIRNLNKGTIRVGGSNYVLSSIMPSILKHIFLKHSGIQVDITEDNSFNLCNLLECGELDLIIDSFEDSEKNFTYNKLIEETILLAVPVRAPINLHLKKFQVTKEHIIKRDYSEVALSREQTEELLKMPFVFLKAENNMHQHAVNTFKQYGVQPNVRLYLDQLVTSLKYTEYGLGCSFVTDTMFRYGNHLGEVCLYAYDGNEKRRNMSIIHKHNKYISNANRLFIQIAQQSFGNYVDDM